MGSCKCSDPRGDCLLVLEQVKDVKGNEVVCTAVNDALLDGLLTVIHSERGGDGMSSLQVQLQPLDIQYLEDAVS